MVDKKQWVDTELGLKAALRESIEKPTVYSAGGGLYLRRRPGGSNSWFFASAKGGRRRELGLGSYPRVKLAVARAEARKITISLDEGRDPFAERASVKSSSEGAPTTPTVPLFGDWADTFIDGIKDGFKNEIHKAQWPATIKQHAKPLLAMRVDAITTDDVVDVLRPIWTTKNETASRLRGRIERILDAAAAKGFRDPDKRNPATWKGHLEHFLPKRPKKSQRGNHAAVPWAEMPAFWTKLAARRNSTSVQALRFTILTAARTGEVIGARVKELDLEAAIWTVPAERMKMSLEHQVALSASALAIAKEMALGLGPDDYLFPGLRKGTALSNMAMLMLLQDDMKHEETVHGFRSSFRDWAGDATDYPRELAEMALAHAIGDATEAAYRRGRALEKRRPLMDDWARYLASGADRKAAPEASAVTEAPPTTGTAKNGRRPMGHPDQTALFGHS